MVMNTLARADSSAPAPVYRVLLTGGPCGGKSAALDLLKSRFLDCGFHVCVVPENATFIFKNSGGFDPAWAEDKDSLRRLQGIFMRFQVAAEDSFIDAARLRKNCPRGSIVLCDRGTLDGKTFLEPNEFDKLLEEENTTEEKLMGRYDVVIHMVTAAIDAECHYEFGEGSNNPDRYHNREEAIEADLIGRGIYKDHPNFVVIDNSTDFEEKVSRVQDEVFTCLGLTYSKGNHVCEDEHVCTFAEGEEGELDDMYVEDEATPVSMRSKTEAVSPASILDLPLSREQRDQVRYVA